MKEFFITGTDTDCGKTYVTQVLIEWFNEQGQSCIGLKPIASGCDWYEGQWGNEDVLKLTKTNKTTLPINQWRFDEPIAPHLAASRQNVRLSASDILQFCREKAFSHYAVKLIEGAGGLMVPLNENETWVDFIALSQMPVVVVIPIQLGCINHALLTFSAISEFNLPVAGWIANIKEPNSGEVESNIDAIKKWVSPPLLGRVDCHQTMVETGAMYDLTMAEDGFVV